MTATNYYAPIAIGVTGHRLARLADVDLAGLRARIEEVMAALSAASPESRFRLIGSLAEGADMVAADAALGRSWQLDTVLPFARDDYAEDFDGAGETGLRAGWIDPPTCWNCRAGATSRAASNL